MRKLYKIPTLPQKIILHKRQIVCFYEQKESEQNLTHKQVHVMKYFL